MNIRLIKHITFAIVCLTIIGSDVDGMKRSRNTRDASSSTPSGNSRRPELIAGSTRDYYRLAERYGITRPTRTPATTPTPITPTPTSSSEDGALGDGEAFMNPREDGKDHETKQSHSSRHIPHALSLEADAEKNIDLEASAIKKAKLDLEAKAAQEEQTEETKKAASLEEKKEEKEEKSSVIDPALTALRATAGRRARHHASIELGDAKRTEPTTAVIPSTHTESSSLSSLLNLDEREGKGEISQEEITRRIRAEIKEAYKPLPDLPYQGLDVHDADEKPALPTPRITATDIPTLIARIQRLLRLGHTPEAIGAAIKTSGFDINGIRIRHFDSIRKKCNLIAKNISRCIRGGFYDFNIEDNGMNALQWAVYSSSDIQRSGPGGGILPGDQQIIQALIAGGALPSVKVNAGRIFRGNSGMCHHGRDALYLAFNKAGWSPSHLNNAIMIILLKAHPNPRPVIQEACRKPFHLSTTPIIQEAQQHRPLIIALTHGYPAALLRELFIKKVITNVNVIMKDPNEYSPETKNAGLYFAPNITPICLKRWCHIQDTYMSYALLSDKLPEEADREVIAVLAEFGADPDPIWGRPDASARDRACIQAWLRGREVWENKQSKIAAKPVLTALTYGDLRPFDPAITSSSDAITSPATQILPASIVDLIVDKI